MSISHDDIGENLRRIVVSGRLDMVGTNAIAARLVELTAAPKKGIVVDMTAVEFLASVGIRALIASAKSVKERGGQMVMIVKRSSTVMLSLKATGVDLLIPVFDNDADAERAALA